MTRAGSVSRAINKSIDSLVHDAIDRTVGEQVITPAPIFTPVVGQCQWMLSDTLIERLGYSVS